MSDLYPYLPARRGILGFLRVLVCVAVPLSAAALVAASCGGGGGSGGPDPDIERPVANGPAGIGRTDADAGAVRGDPRPGVRAGVRLRGADGRGRRQIYENREFQEPVGPEGDRRRPGLRQPRAAVGSRGKAGRGRDRRRSGYGHRPFAPRVQEHADLRADPQGREGRGREPFLARHGGGQRHRGGGGSTSPDRRVGHRTGRRARRLRAAAGLQRRDLQASSVRSPGVERGLFCRYLQRHNRVAL